MTDNKNQIQVYNTLSGKKEVLVPLRENELTIYSCGPTVYDWSHLGHARMSVVWDVAQRYFRYCGYKVTYIRNITDIDDKIINRAAEMGITAEKLARHFTYTFWDDMHRLNVQSPDREPRATEFVTQMIDFIEGLIKNGHAYQSGSDVYFDVMSLASYGELSGRKVEDLLSGARDQVLSQEELAERKKNACDFALWKSTSASPSWKTPWGEGRPGWHLECSTMIKHVLGETIDIHTGGEDLIFPHHENEIAQSQALHQKPLAKYWMHNSFVQVSAEKMSKSLGNFSTIREILKNYSPDTVRLFILQSHYRSPIDFTNESLNASRQAMLRLLRAVFQHSNPTQLQLNANNQRRTDILQLDQLKDEVSTAFIQDFDDAMNNDLNTAQALSACFNLADKISKESNRPQKDNLAGLLAFHLQLLGFTLEDSRRVVSSEIGKSVLDLIVELRQEARLKKDYATSDLIRQKLTDCGITLMDGQGGKSDWELE
ncbi:cysteine--tRNA ligase [bacterium]|nr:cysteine--tRNA ligase [bacterium]